MKKTLIMLLIGCAVLTGCNSDKSNSPTSSVSVNNVTENSYETIAEPITEIVTETVTEQVTEAVTKPATEELTETSTKPTTEALTVIPTEPTTETLIQVPTEPTTVTPTQAPTEPTTVASTQAPTEPTTEAFTQATTQPATEAITVAPTQPVTQPLTEAPTQPVTQPPASTSLDGYTFTELNQVMEVRYYSIHPMPGVINCILNPYCLNVFNAPTIYADVKLGKLTDGDTILVTGRCNETDMYRVEYNGQTGYMSDNYLYRTDIPHEDSRYDIYDGKKQDYIQPPISNGDELAFTGTTTLKNSGITIPVLNKFNTTVLLSSYDYSWFGVKDNATAIANYEFMKQKTEEIEVVFDSLGWISDRGNDFDCFDCGDFSWNLYPNSSIMPDITIRRPYFGEEYCILYIATPLDYEAATAFNYNMWDYEELYYQDALTVLLSTFSSTPVELQEAILDSMYYSENGKEPIFEKWTRIGDCQIRADLALCDGENHFTFRIKQ